MKTYGLMKALVVGAMCLWAAPVFALPASSTAGERPPVVKEPPKEAEKPPFLRLLEIEDSISKSSSDDRRSEFLKKLRQMYRNPMFGI